MKINALAMVQEGETFYVTVMKAGDIKKLAQPDLYRTENGVERGYQRPPERPRAIKVMRYLKTRRPLMPLSMLLAYRGKLETSPPRDGIVTLTIPEGVRMYTVDGQHREAGFIVAIDEEGIARLADYPLPVVIWDASEEIEEAQQFRLINETMKKVRTDLASRILAMLVTTREGRKEVREAGREAESNAVLVMKALSTDSSSLWLSRIQAPHERKNRDHIIRETSFESTLKPLLTTRPYSTWEPNRLAKVINTFWKAWEGLVPECFAEPSEFVLQKTPGAYSLHELLVFVLEVLREQGITSPTVDDFVAILRDLGNYATAEYWRAENSEGAAVFGSMKGFGILYDLMEGELKEAGHGQ
ncbi:MAG: DGQHR domain-containing protein [Dehalococcoidia bacterium]|nr:DGQHR domain-containing protein [Dehalococcoidia bacterium]